MRHTRAHTANRRSHHALKGTRLTVSKEGGVHPRHKVLLDGSMYRGRSVMDVQSKRIVRAQKAAKKRGDVASEEKQTTEKA
jgi:ribosomal protein L32